MKKILLMASLLALTQMSGAAESFDPKEPITIELRDAKLSDVLATLGALANLPVRIEPGLDEKVTLQLERVPLEKVLEIISRTQNLSVRVEGGMLVASRVHESLPAAPVTPEKFRAAPRIPLSEYARAAASPPSLLIATTWKGEESCWVAKIGNSGGGLVEVPLSKTGSAELLVADMGYDPVLKLRVVALEALDGTFKHAVSLFPDHAPVSIYKTKDGESVRLLVSQAPKLIARYSEKSCAGLVFKSSEAGAPVTVTMQANALSENGVSYPVFSPRVQTTAGSVFKALGSEASSGDGALRGYAVSGYVSRDGKSIAVAFKARAVWTDPEDGRQYYFTQAGSQVGFFPLANRAVGGFPASAVSPGAATSLPLELRVFGEE